MKSTKLDNVENLLLGQDYKPEAKFTIETLLKVFMDSFMISDEIKALEFARFLVERGAKNNLLEDGTPNLQRAILGCHLITHLMSKLHMMGTLHVSD